MKRTLLIAFLVMVAGVLGGAVWLLFPSDSDVIAPKVIVAAKEPRNRHEADLPVTVPAEKFDPRFILMRAWDRARIPVVDRFISPLGSRQGAFVYDAQSFGVDNSDRGGKHAGQDLNGIGGENTDMGDPVYVSGRGMVTYTGTPSRDWGKVVVIAHRLPDGRIVQTLYAHLLDYNVFPRQIVNSGERLGRVGNADGLYFAHLHYEAIDSAQNEAGNPGYFTGNTNRFSPVELEARLKKEGTPYTADDIFSTLEGLELQRKRSNIQFKIDLPKSSAALAH